MTADLANQYLYDVEVRVCAVDSSTNGVTLYLYNASGQRVAKGTGSFSCNMATNGFTLTHRYVLDLAGRQMTEYDGSTWLHTNVFADGQLLATYSATGTPLAFALNDWLGTKRVQAKADGEADTSFLSLPYGDNEVTNGSGPNATEHFFTGKVRDAESGNDYFGARYYNSNDDRWITPDESLDGTIMELPQTWNKYSYEYNRPLYGTDPDGRCPPCIGAIIGGAVEGGYDLGKQLYYKDGNFSKVSWREVGANVAGGAVTGAIAGSTGGTSLILDAAGGAIGNSVGGVATRGLEGKSANDVLSAHAISADALAGFVGGGIAHVAAEFVHIPDEPHFSFNGSTRRFYNRAYRQALRDMRSRSTQAFIYQGFAAAAPSSFITHVTNWLEEWFFDESPQPPLNPHSTVKFFNCVGISGGASGVPCQ